MTIDSMTLGARVRAARRQCDMSQAELARRVGVSVTAMNCLERGHTADPHWSIVVRIATVLGVSLDSLSVGTCAPLVR